MLVSVVCFFFLLVSTSCVSKSSEHTTKDSWHVDDVSLFRYAVVVDAGSTGSRGFVTRIHVDQSGSRNVASLKGKKVTPGLSDFAHNPADAVEYIMPVLQDAATIIPPAAHNSTAVYIKGTAGLRLLEIGEQDRLWDVLCEGLSGHRENPFQIVRSNMGTITGHMEAYYAVLTSNYIAGSIDGDLM